MLISAHLITCHVKKIDIKIKKNEIKLDVTLSCKCAFFVYLSREKLCRSEETMEIALRGH